MTTACPRKIWKSSPSGLTAGNLKAILPTCRRPRSSRRRPAAPTPLRVPRFPFSAWARSKGQSRSRASAPCTFLRAASSRPSLSNPAAPSCPCSGSRNSTPPGALRSTTSASLCSFLPEPGSRSRRAPAECCCIRRNLPQLGHRYIELRGVDHAFALELHPDLVSAGAREDQVELHLRTAVGDYRMVVNHIDQD